MFEAPPLTLNGTPPPHTHTPRRSPRGMCDSLFSDTSCPPRVLLPHRARDWDRGGGAGMGGRGGLRRCDCAGGRAGRGQAVSSELGASSPRARGHARLGRGPLPTWQSQRAQVSVAGALGRAWLGCRQRAREGAWGRAGDTREAGLGGGPWAAPPAPCPPTRSSRPGGKSCGCPLRALPPPRPRSYL